MTIHGKKIIDNRISAASLYSIWAAGREGLMFDDLFFEEWTEGITGIEYKNNIEIFPNPAGDLLFVRTSFLDKGMVQIINLNGHILSETLLNGKVTNINTANLKPGVYLVRVIMDKYFITKKLIKR